MREQKKFGGNGKIIINDELKIATKLLKNPKNMNSYTRFIEEMKILKSIQNKDIDNVVMIINIDEQNLKIDMKLYDGDMTKIYNITKGNVRKTLELIRPVIIALKKLSELENPIYHRDLKPNNLLVELNGEEVKLILADFGCAYIGHEENKRITDDFRAVGAQQYRAPEYQYGKVEDVDSTGDIFSIGKLIWNLMVGNEGEVFPYTLWFPKEYNLCERFNNTGEIISLNLLIASCVNYDKNLRATYDELISSIDNLLCGNIINTDLSTIIQAKAFESVRLFKEAERQEKIKLLLKMFYDDLKKTIIYLNEHMELEIIKSVKEQYTNHEQYITLIANKIILDGPETILFKSNFQEIFMVFSYRPKSNVNSILDISGVDKDLPYIYSFYGGMTGYGDLTIFFINGILHYKSNKSDYKIYDKNTLQNYFNDFIRDYIRL